MTARDVKAALRRRYAKPSQGRPDGQYVCIEEARSGAGFDGNNGQCDFLAINTWQSRGMELIGHEVKVSVSDWRAELKQPEKAERFARYCSRWYVAVPSALAKKIRDDVPPAWGLMSVSDAGRVTEIVSAPRRENVETPPAWGWIGWLAQVDREQKAMIPKLVTEALAPERDRLVAEGKKDAEREIKWLRQYQTQTGTKIDEISDALGVNIRYGYVNWARVKRAMALTAADNDIGFVPGRLRAVADELDEALAPIKVPAQ